MVLKRATIRPQARSRASEPGSRGSERRLHGLEGGMHEPSGVAAELARRKGVGSSYVSQMGNLTTPASVIVVAVTDLNDCRENPLPESNLST